MKKHILIVMGTRPEAIKMAPVYQRLKQNDEIFNVKVAVTAQHREMLDQVVRLFKIDVKYDLDLMRPNQDLGTLTANAIVGLQTVIEKDKPDVVLVHGDTTTTLAASLAAYYTKTALGHVEAGLRTGEKYAPFPEELNRKITGAISDYHFAPTETARRNLLTEGICEEKIWITGNTVIDALLEIVGRIEQSQKLRNSLAEEFPFLEKERKIVLITGHRRENFGRGFESICGAIRELASSRSDIELVYPVHMNPNVREPVNRILGGMERVHLLEPLEYLPFVYLMMKSFIILTDSGGIQEEAPSLGKPVLVMRELTERPDAVEAGTVKMVGTNSQTIVNTANELLDDKKRYKEMSTIANPYGDGHASDRIADVIGNNLP